MFQKTLHTLGRFLRCQRGSPAIEFAILAPVLLVMGIGVVDFGLAVRAKSETEAATRAAMQKGFGNMWDVAAMTAAARDTISTDPVEQAATSVTAVPSCFCDGALSTTGAGCTKTTTCGGGGKLDFYLTVTVSRPYDLMMDYFVINSPMTLSADVFFRAQP